MAKLTDASINRPALLRLFISGTMWSFLGVILTVAFFYWTQYRNPFDFEITIDDEVDLVQVRDRIADLEIKYKNEDILNTPKALKVLRITLRNSGQTILQNQYDHTEGFGLVFGNAEVLDTAVTDSNTEYLKTHLLPKAPSKAVSRADGQVSATYVGVLPLEKVIFEKGKFATLKVFLLQQKNEPAIISVLGKIANIDHLTVKRSLPGEEKQTFSVVPFLSFIGAYVGAIVAMVSLRAYMRKYSRVRRRKSREFLNTHRGLTPEQHAIVMAYRDYWNSRLSLIVRRLAAGDEMVDLLDHFREEIRSHTKGLLRSFFLLSLPAPRMNFVNKQIFLRDGIIIRFNPQNEKFIREFFTAMGEIPKEPEP